MSSRRDKVSDLDVLGDEQQRFQFLKVSYGDANCRKRAWKILPARPADESCVRLDFQEREDAPAGVRM